MRRLDRVICKESEIPEGWVVVGECHSASCPGEGQNAWVVKRPGRRDVICDFSPVPDGYRRLHPTHSAGCPGEGENALVIVRDDE
jgi:ribosomal protein L36